jgi:hypothetical protein
MRSTWLTALPSLLRHLLTVTSLLYLLVYLYIVTTRIDYPFELAWIEAVALKHVRCILADKSICMVAGLEFAPFIYTPIYFYLLAGLAALVGEGFVGS